MSRLHEFITCIRRTRTQAQQRAEYQKQMAVIRESFAKNEENTRARNVTKLLFINMSGQETNFGQMQCLTLMTGNALIEKRIGYLGLTQLFNQKSELLMMATNRIRVDLTHSSANLVAMALCVLSEICTPEIATELHKEVLRCVNNSVKLIKKKAILVSIKLLKKAPQFLPDFFPEVLDCLNDKNHGVLLGTFAFLENAILLDEKKVDDLITSMQKIAAVYREIVTEFNSDYEIGGVQDPFLQVAILRLLRTMKKFTSDHNFMKFYGEILVNSHDGICSKTTESIKNGANAILFECFQCFMTIPPNPTLCSYTENTLVKFVSTKDANSIYLSLFNLLLMAKHDLAVARSYSKTILECLAEDDLLIRVMALNLLYLIATPENASTIIKELLNVLLKAMDEEFIAELSQNICLIVEKHSQSRRWHFDTILKVLILADQAVRENSAKSLVHLIAITPQLQQYCLTRLFFSSAQNLRNDTLCKVTMFLLGEFSWVLTQVKQIQIKDVNIVDLIQQIIFRPGAAPQTIQYGLSALFKMYDKFSQHKQRIFQMIKVFQTHSDLQVQKRSCEYTKLLQPIWKDERVKEICIPIPPLRGVAENFSGIPVGDTTMNLETEILKMPIKLNINYEQQMNNAQRENGQKIEESQSPEPIPSPLPIITPIPKSPKTKPEITAPKKIVSLLDDDDEVEPQKVPPIVKTTSEKTQNAGDPFNILGLNLATGTPILKGKQLSEGIGLGNLLEGSSQPHSFPQQANQVQNTPNLLGNTLSTNITLQPNPTNSSSLPVGFDLLLGAPATPKSQAPSVAFPQKQPTSPQKQLPSFKFKAYETPHLQLWVEGRQESPGSTRIAAHFNNKTSSYIEQLALQTAVMKYLKIVIQPMSGTNLPPMSKGQVTQVMVVNNSAVGEKAIIMKIKLSYVVNGQKCNFQDKLQEFPIGF